MQKILVCCLLQLLFVGIIFAQDYQDYEAAAPRAAPIRLRPTSDSQDTRPTPVPILKQINRHNEDGSYTYGYEGADGSFKIETKLATGEVKGKYGYVDETGKVRVVEYGANKYGFQPSGEGITVAPPTLVDETTNKEGALPEYEDEPQPQKPYIARVSRPQARPAPQYRPAPRPEPQYVEYEQEPEPAPRPQYAPSPVHQSARPQQYSQAPSPPRLQIPGAQPSDVVYSSQQRPARPDPQFTQTQTFSAPQQQVRVSRPIFSPSPVADRAGPSIRPVSEPQSSYAIRPAPQQIAYSAPSPPQGRSTSVLDQLAKDYALPQGGAQPLHDITFGYY